MLGTIISQRRHQSSFGSVGTVAVELQPEKENLDRTFSQTVFHIDFYQRSYKWSEIPVRRLLDDVFFPFNELWKKYAALEPSVSNVTERYPWYYLNTYVTNTIDGRVFVVDGQQRLTTLTLILIKLYHLASKFDSERRSWIESKIVGHSGDGLNFWMNHEDHLGVLRALYAGTPTDEIDTGSGVTAVNMVDNYRLIDAYLEDTLSESRRFETFSVYFLKRLVLVNLEVGSTDVPMVFEVINDRGVRLRPHEILKGKLLGQVDKLEISQLALNELWDSRIEELSSYGDDVPDDFFRTWLKGRFAATRSTGRRFDGDYHREMFTHEMNQVLKLEHDAVAVKRFLLEDFAYYSRLFLRVQFLTRVETAGYEGIYFNGAVINKLDSQVSLVLAACSIDDPEEDAKIAAVGAGIDKLSTLLRLQGAYSSNEFLDRLFLIAADLHGQNAADIPGIFEQHLQAEIALRRGIEHPGAFNRQLFNTMTVDRLGSRFTRYFFARVEKYIAGGMKKEMKHPFEDLVTKTGYKTGFHIEHILSYNDDNRSLYGDDEERFDAERGRLGGILLLRGRDNISSTNEPYAAKLRTYANSLYWNETLRADTYKSKKDFADFIREERLNLRPLESFGPQELIERHELLGEIVQRIWPVSATTTSGASPTQTPELAIDEPADVLG